MAMEAMAMMIRTDTMMDVAYACSDHGGSWSRIVSRVELEVLPR
jgi:hypothetical protein